MGLQYSTLEWKLLNVILMQSNPEDERQAFLNEVAEYQAIHNKLEQRIQDIEK